MLCTGCDHQNRTGARHCTRCGLALATACPGCGIQAEAEDRFCAGCGAALQEKAAPVHAAGSASVALALIKTEGLDEAGRARVRREAQAMGQLGDHPHVVMVHDIGEEGEHLYIVSQYMEGGDLEERLAHVDGRRLPLEDALRIGREICEALEHATE